MEEDGHIDRKTDSRGMNVTMNSAPRCGWAMSAFSVDVITRECSCLVLC